MKVRQPLSKVQIALGDQYNKNILRIPILVNEIIQTPIQKSVKFQSKLSPLL